MSSQALLAFKAELQSAKITIEPQIEGLHDFARLNVKPETLIKVQQTTVDFERRLDLMVYTLAALENLEQDQYPDVALRDVLQSVHADLADNVNTIEAAFALFAPIEEAVTAEITAGTPEERPNAP